MVEQRVWKISVSRISLVGQVLDFIDSAWIELPAGESFILTAGEEKVLSDNATATPSDPMTGVLGATGSLSLPTRPGVPVFALPEGTSLHFAEKTINLQSAGFWTDLKA